MVLLMIQTFSLTTLVGVGTMLLHNTLLFTHHYNSWFLQEYKKKVQKQLLARSFAPWKKHFEIVESSLYKISKWCNLIYILSEHIKAYTSLPFKYTGILVYAEHSKFPTFVRWACKLYICQNKKALFYNIARKSIMSTCLFICIQGNIPTTSSYKIKKSEEVVIYNNSKNRIFHLYLYHKIGNVSITNFVLSTKL